MYKYIGTNITCSPILVQHSRLFSENKRMCGSTFTTYKIISFVSIPLSRFFYHILHSCLWELRSVYCIIWSKAWSRIYTVVINMLLTQFHLFPQMFLKFRFHGKCVLHFLEMFKYLLLYPNFLYTTKLRDMSRTTNKRLRTKVSRAALYLSVTMFCLWRQCKCILSFRVCLGSNFLILIVHRQLLKKCFLSSSQRVRCFELYSVHLGLVTSACVLEQCRRLTATIWEVTGVSTNPLDLL